MYAFLTEMFVCLIMILTSNKQIKSVKSRLRLSLTLTARTHTNTDRHTRVGGGTNYINYDSVIPFYIVLLISQKQYNVVYYVSFSVFLQ